MTRWSAACLASRIAEVGYWLATPKEGWIENTDLEALIRHARRLHEQGQFRRARVGKGATRQLASSIRTDEIHWIQDWTPPPLAPFRALLENVKAAGRRELFLPIKRYESHFSLYPPGAYYRAHVDRHRRLPSRLLSLVLYLNDLEEGSGGELKLYPKGRDPVVVRPQAGLWVVFDSRLRHEVCLTHQQRWSFTSWFRDDEILGIEGI